LLFSFPLQEDENCYHPAGNEFSISPLNTRGARRKKAKYKFRIITSRAGVRKNTQALEDLLIRIWNPKNRKI